MVGAGCRATPVLEDQNLVPTVLYAPHTRQSGPKSVLDSLTCAEFARQEGEGHKTRRYLRVTYPESYITKYTTFTKKTEKSVEIGP